MVKRLKLKKKYFIVLVVLSFMAVFALVMGVSYAYFTTTVKGKDFVIYTGNLAVDYEKKTDVINLDNLYPMTDQEGLTLTAHEFVVKNNGNIDARYQVRLELDNTLTDMISLEYIKMAYSIDGSSYSNPVLLSNLDTSLAFIRNRVLEPTGSNTIAVKLWIDLNAPNEIQGKEFKARIVVDSIQDVEEGYVVDTVPIIYLNKDESGNQDMIITTNGTYTELGVNRVLDDKQVFTTSEVTTTYEYYDGVTTTVVDSIDTSKVGIYYVTYSITDSDNNVGKSVRVVAVGDDTSLKIYHDIDSVIASFDSTSLKEVIMCSYIDGNDRLYFDCKIHDTIENALASKTKGVIIMTSDIERDSSITINSDKEIALELNEKTITFSETYSILNRGTLYVNQYSDTGTIIAYSRALVTYGSTSIYNGQFINNQETNDGTSTLFVAHGGILNVYGDKATFDESSNYISGTYIKGQENSAINMQVGAVNVYGGTIEMSGNIAAIRSNYNGTATINIYDGEIIGAGRGIGLDGNCPSTSEINVHGGTIHSGTFAAVYNSSLGAINIYSGVISTDSDQNTVANLSTGTININQTIKPLYITSLSQEWKPAIGNTSTGTININGVQANSCTSDPNDTTSGLCVYARGNSDEITNNSAVRNYSSGTINIDGGSYYATYHTFNNNSDGTINIYSGLVISDYFALYNYGTGTVNIIQTDKPLYMTTLAQTWAGTLVNNSSGIINITANQANACTSNYNDTTSGLCVYAEGDGTTSNTTGNTAILTTSNCTGNINIDGGTYYGGYVSIINPGYQSGAINIKNAKLISKAYGVITNRTGTTRICNSILSAPNDLVSNQTAVIEYSSDVKFNDGTNTPITSGTGTITKVDTCSITVE